MIARLLSRPASVNQVTHAQRLWLYILTTLILVFLAAPTFIVVPMSFSASTFLEFPPREWSLRWYSNYFELTEWMDATIVSFKVALSTVLIATPAGTMAAYGLHASASRWSRHLSVMLVMPLMVPMILIAIGLFFLFARIGLTNTLFGLILAHATLSIPFVLVVVSAGLHSFDMDQELAARILGANRLRAFLTVTLPQIRFSVISGALFAFITSFDEVIIAMFLATGPNSTLTRRMFLALRDTIDPTIAAISTCLIVLSIVLLGLAQVFGHNKSRPD